MDLLKFIVAPIVALFVLCNFEVLGQGNPVFHTVESGETLYAISRKYNISVTDIRSWNGMSSNIISIGETLIVGYETSVSQNQPAASKETDDAESNQYHTVKAGETLYALSRKYGVSVQDIKTWNNRSSNELRIGQRLVVGKVVQEASPEKNEVAPTSIKSSGAGEESGQFLVYSRAVEYGDEALAAKQYQAALSYYKTALALMPEMKYPQQKIEEIQTALDISTPDITEEITDNVKVTPVNTELEKAPLEDQPDKYALYFEAVDKADSAFADQDYEMALISYQAALDALPEMIYPQRKIEEIEELKALNAAEKSLKEVDDTLREETALEHTDATDTSSLEPGQVETHEAPVDNGLMAFTHYAMLKNKPSDFGKVIKYLPPDTEVYLLDLHSGGRNYYKVKYNDQLGYVHKKNIKKTPEVKNFNGALE